MKATRYRVGHQAHVSVCLCCTRRFTARTATVAELQLEAHLAQDGCRNAKPKAVQPQTRELFE